MIKKWLLFLCLVVFVLGTAVFLSKPFLERAIQSKIEQQARQSAGTNLKIGRLGLHFVPLELDLEQVTVEQTGHFKGRIQSLSTRIHWLDLFFARLFIHLDAKHADLVFSAALQSASKTSTQQTHAPTAFPRLPILDLGVAVDVDDLTVRKLKAETVEWSVTVDRLFVAKNSFQAEREPLIFGISGHFNAADLNVPYEIKSSHFLYSAEQLSADPVEVDIGGLRSHWRWKAAADLQDMEATGRLDLHEDVQFHKGFKKASGFISGEGTVAAQVKNNKLFIEPSALKLDFSSLQLSLDPYFSKPAGVPLVVTLNLSGQESMVKLSDIQVRFASAILKAQVQLQKQIKNARLDFQARLIPLSLDSVQKYFPTFSTLPLHGEISAEANGQIPLEEPKRASMQDNVRITGNVQAKIFDGAVFIPRFSVQPKNPSAFFSADVKADRLDLAQLAQLASPSHEPQVSGRLRTQVKISGSDPRQPSFLDDMRAEGTMDLLDTRMKSMPLQSTAQRLLQQLPGVGQNSTSELTDLPMDVNTRFRLAKKVATLDPLHAKTRRDDDLQMKGTVTLQFMAHLLGEFRLADPPVHGDFLRANQDQKGRLILPLVIDGDLRHPKIDFLSSTLQQMMTKMLNFEKDQMIKKGVDNALKNLKGLIGQ